MADQHFLVKETEKIPIYLMIMDEDREKEIAGCLQAMIIHMKHWSMQDRC